MPKALNIKGQKFGKLTVIEKALSRSKKTYWLCQCECGVQKEVQTGHLTSGAITSCGCNKNNLELEEKNCLLCGNKFKPNNYKRLYCYDCSPAGVGAAQAIKNKKRALKHKLIEYKGGKCQICGYNKCEGALQFHHRNPKEKEFALSQINLNDTDITIDKIIEEIDKCDLLCANCHAEQHYSEN